MSDNTELNFFYFPRACSLAAHIALEESGLKYTRHIVDLRTLQNREPKYLGLNPTGAVPALSIGSQTLTETQALLTYIADRVPEKKLIPPTGDFKRYQAHEWMNFMSSSVHTYIRSIFRPAVYGGDSDLISTAVAKKGVVNLGKAIATVEKRLKGKQWALGDSFSVADAYLFIMYLWTTDERISSVPERPYWEAIAQRVWQRAAVQRVVTIEQKDRDYKIPWN
jgi:glutathione S-transferase